MNIMSIYPYSQLAVSGATRVSPLGVMMPRVRWSSAQSQARMRRCRRTGVHGPWPSLRI